MKKKTNIAIIGTGYVGLVSAVCFAELGNKVIAYDKNKEKIKLLQKGKSPIYEPYLEKLILKNQKKKRLFFAEDINQAVKPSSIIFICVGTPPLKNGEADLSAVEIVCREIAKNLNSYKLIVEKSTVPVQTGLWLERIIKINQGRNVNFDIASNPEFLREGSAIYDFFHPYRIVVGVKTKKAEELLFEIYQPIIKGKFKCPIHPVRDRQKEKVPLIITDINSAEIIKHASNSFLATKISFINALADICEKTGANIKDVAYGMGLDKRIGREFLNAGLGFGGFCFPKDLQAFMRMSEKHGYDFKLLKEVERINEERISRAIEKLKNHLRILKRKTIGILGLSFKPNTDDIRFSPALKLIKKLLKQKVIIKAYDPKAMEKSKKELPEIIYCRNPYEAAKNSDALIICTEWQEFQKLNWRKIKKIMKQPFVLDARNMLNKKTMEKLGFEYQGFGA